MKTICFCNSNIAWGGGEKWHLDMALAFAAQGWKVFVCCHPKGALLQRARLHEGLECVPFSIHNFSFCNPFLVKKAYDFFTKEKIDALIVNLPIDLKSFVPAAKKAKVPCVMYRRGSALAVKDTLLNRYLYSLLTKLIVNSKATQDAVLANNSQLIALDRILFLPNSIDVELFSQQIKHSGQLQSPSLEQLRSSPTSLILGNAGRLNKQKGQSFLLFLVKELEARGVDVHLLIAGEGEELEPLKHLAKSLSVEKRVHFLGFLEDVAVFWRSIDSFVLSSLWEGFGYVLLESMLASVPICALDTSNIPELVKDDWNGFLFPFPKTEEERDLIIKNMAEKLVQLKADLGLRERLTTNALSFANENFSFENSFKQLEEAIVQELGK